MFLLRLPGLTIAGGTLEWLPRQRLAWSELKKTENFVFLVLGVEPGPALARQVLYH